MPTITYAVEEGGVARIALNRPEQRNAQNTHLIYELNAAFDSANADPAVNAIVLAAEGPHFSSGHDLKDYSGKLGKDYPVVGTWSEFGKPGAEGVMSREQEIYLKMCRRWREIAKPTIAEVQGKCVAGGLMLAWSCDLIFASQDALFSDPVLEFGGPGVEFFAHPWELGCRRAKDFLFIGEEITAEEAKLIGLVNRVFEKDELTAETMRLARRIAAKPSFYVRLAKEAINNTQEIQGFYQAINSAFYLHQLSHSHNFQLHNASVNPEGLPPVLRDKRNK